MQGEAELSAERKLRPKVRFAFNEAEKRALAVLTFLIVLGLTLRLSTGLFVQSSAEISIVAPDGESKELSTPNSISERHLDSVGVDGSKNDYLSSEKSLKTRDSSVVALSISINSADVAALKRLPGIGPVLADRIIRFRETNGQFLEEEDLLMVKGIGEKKFNRIRDQITVK